VISIFHLRDKNSFDVIYQPASSVSKLLHNWQMDKNGEMLQLLIHFDGFQLADNCQT